MREFLKRLIRWLLELLGLRDDRPSSLISLEYDAMNARLNWTLPTPTLMQRPIAYVRIDGRVEGVAEWSEINSVAPPETTLLIQDISPGEWEFRGIVVDDRGRESDPLTASLVIPFDRPSSLETFTATIE